MDGTVKQVLKNNPSVTVSIRYYPFNDEFEVRLSNYHTNKHAYMIFRDINEISLDKMVWIVSNRFREELLE